MSAEDVRLVREALDLLCAEDLRLNGCACNPGESCYLHARIIPEKTRPALDRLEARLAEAERERDALLLMRPSLQEVRVATENDAAHLQAAKARLARLERIEEAARELDELNPTLPAFLHDEQWGAAARRLHVALAATEEGAE